MLLSVLNNSAAQTSLWELNRNNDKMSKSLKKVSSGMKINSAGDDVSSYAISERMRIQIRALDQSNDNAMTGKNMVDLAAAAVDQQIDIMRQIHSRTLQASDDTYTDQDRESLQKEISQLIDESEQIAQNTTYNGVSLLNQTKMGTTGKQLYYFDPDIPYHLNPTGVTALTQLTGGDYVPRSNYIPIFLGITMTWDATTLTKNTGLPAVGSSIYLNDPVADPTIIGQSVTVAETPYSKQRVWLSGGSGGITEEKIDFASLFNSGLNIPDDIDGLGFSIKCNMCPQFITIKFDASTDSSAYYVGKTNVVPPPLCYKIGVQSVTDEKSLMGAVYNGLSSVSPLSNGSTLPSSSDMSVQIAELHDIRVGYSATDNTLYLYKDGPPMTLMNGITGDLVAEDTLESAKLPEQDLFIQGSEKGSQNTKLSIPNTTLSILFPSERANWGIEPAESDYPTEWSSDYANCRNETERRRKWRNEVWSYPTDYVELDSESCVRTRRSASQFLTHVDQAIKYLLDVSTTLGAQSSRMDYTKMNLTVSATQIRAAESTIRDADMAKEYTEHMKNTILSQTAQSMLAQTNQSSSNVLGLLK